MPWKVVEKDGKYCVVKSDDGSTVKCYADKVQADAQRKALYANYKMEQDQEHILLEHVGPALVAVAVTAKPHLRQRGQEIKIVERNGEKLVEVPLFKKGIYRPKGDSGPIIFNDAFVNRMVKNHNERVTDYNVHLDFRHSDKVGALAFLDPDDGGFLEVKGDWLYAYGKPIDDEATSIINSRKWRYASPEFAPNYESNFVQKLSADDLNEISIEDLVDQTEEFMTKKLTLGTKVIVLEGEVQDGQVTEIEAAYKELADKATSLEAKVTELTPDPEPQLPEAARVRLEALEAENKLIKQERINDQINLVLERARSHKDGRGYGHDKVFLDLVEAALKRTNYEQDGLVIKLEGDGKTVDLVGFYNSILMTMLEKCPGTVPVKANTRADDVRLESDNGHYTPEELTEATTKFWN